MVKKVTLATRDFESEFALASLQSLILSNKAWQVYTKHPSPLGRKDGEEEDDEVDQDEDRPFLGFKTQAMKCEASPRQVTGNLIPHQKYSLHLGSASLWIKRFNTETGRGDPMHCIKWFVVTFWAFQPMRAKCKLRQNIFESIQTNGIDMWEIQDMWDCHGQYATGLMCFRVCC